MKDKIVEEIHRHRAQHAQRFNYDIHAICEDIRRSEAESGGKFVTWDAKRKRLVEVKPPAARRQKLATSKLQSAASHVERAPKKAAKAKATKPA